MGLSLLIPMRTPASESVLSQTAISANSLLEETNAKRIESNAGNLLLDESLIKAAQTKAQDMAARNYWSHVTPDGKQPWHFIEQSGYSYSAAAENLAYGFDSGKETVTGWMNSIQHRQAMLDKTFSNVGFGIVSTPNYQGKGPETIVVALYASPKDTNVNAASSELTGSPSTSISFGQVMTAGSYPWINLLAGIVIGLGSMYLVTKHSLKLRRKLKQGEQYVLHHPVVDISLIAIIITMAVILQTAGFVH